MLSRVLNEINSSTEPISLSVLSQKLNIEPSALDGMLSFWVRKGKLKDDDVETSSDHKSGLVTCNCGPSCNGASNCSFMAKMPKSYSLATKTKGNREV